MWLDRGCGRRLARDRREELPTAVGEEPTKVPHGAVLLRGPLTRRAMHGASWLKNHLPDGMWGGWGTRVTTANGALNYS